MSRKAPFCISSVLVVLITLKPWCRGNTSCNKALKSIMIWSSRKASLRKALFIIRRFMLHILHYLTFGKIHGYIFVRNNWVYLFHLGLEHIIKLLFLGNNWHRSPLLNMFISRSCWQLGNRYHLTYYIPFIHFFNVFHTLSASYSFSYSFSLSSQFCCLCTMSRLLSLRYCSIKAKSLGTSILILASSPLHSVL